MGSYLLELYETKNEYFFKSLRIELCTKCLYRYIVKSKRVYLFENFVFWRYY